MNEKHPFAIDKPHDSLVKASLGNKEVMADFLQSRLPSETLKTLDLSTLKLENSSFITEKMRQRESDLVFSLMAKGKRNYVYVLLEAQSKYDSTMPMRLFHYNYLLWREHQKHYKTATLPQIHKHRALLWQGQLSRAQVPHRSS